MKIPKSTNDMRCKTGIEFADSLLCFFTYINHSHGCGEVGSIMTEIKRFSSYRYHIPLSSIDEQIQADVLNNGSTSVTAISKRTGIERKKVSYHVYRLFQRGLLNVENVSPCLTIVSIKERCQ